jgi:hypothetical protein
MLTRFVLVAGLVAALGCDKGRDTAPTAAERQAAEAAQKEATALEAARERQERASEAAGDRAEREKDLAEDRADREKELAENRADRAEDLAEKRKDVLDETAEAAKDRAEDLSDRAGMDWKGPGEGWERDWETFAAGRDRTRDSGDYTIERDRDGSITAWRKTEQVSGGAFSEVKDAALVAQVKSKLAAADDLKATQINVDAEEHVVRLRGKVDSPQLAAKAVRVALSTPGAQRVVSHLTW